MSQFKFRSIFISDLHLGTKNCKSTYLLDFLRRTHSEYLYLVGDVFDLREMKKSVYWNPDQSDILHEIFRKTSQGTTVIYIPGNHDAWLRRFAGKTFQGIKLQLDAQHITADGRRFFVGHGDEFDSLVRHNKLLKFVGDRSYNWLLRLNRVHNIVLKLRGKPYWSLSAWLKTRVPNARQYIDKFERIAAERATAQNCDGYICGHIHKAGIRQIKDKLYCNDGDWVEHCSAITEESDGTLQLLHWSNHARIEASSQGQKLDTSVYPLPANAAVSALLNSKKENAA